MHGGSIILKVFASANIARKRQVNLKAKIQNIPQSIKLAILIVIAAKVLVLAIGYAVTALNSGPPAPLDILAQTFSRWDAPHYVDIANNWYVNSGDQANFIVFFPLYPILIRLTTFNFAYANLSALAISNISSLIAFFYLYKLAKLEFNSEVAVKAVLFLSVFPTAYFLSVPYTEGLFFATVIASIYYARLGKWHFAGLMGLFASLTRMAGLLLLPVLLVEYFHQRGWKPRKFGFNVSWVFLVLTGFLIYLGINFQVTGNPLTFMTVESAHWNNRLDPWTGLTQAWSWAWNADYPGNITIGAIPLFFAVFGLAAVGIAVWRRLRPSYIVYMFLSWGLAVSTSWWVSVPRYVMAMFPMFILFGALSKNKEATIAIAVVSGATMCYFTVLFALGHWAF